MPENDYPLRFIIRIDRLEIRVMKDFSGKNDFATLVAIDENGNEHSCGYTDENGIDHRVYVESPADGKIKWHTK